MHRSKQQLYSITSSARCRKIRLSGRRGGFIFKVAHRQADQSCDLSANSGLLSKLSIARSGPVNRE
jgi:hypothetical protein